MTITLKIMTLPPGNDPADVFMKPDGPAVWEHAVATAKPAMSWRIERLGNMHDLSTVRGKVDAAQSMLDALLHCSPIERSAYVAELAGILGVREVDLRATLNEQFVAKPATEPRIDPEPRPIAADKNGEAMGFPCPQCGSDRTHYAVKTMRCWNCDEWRMYPTVKALNRQVVSAWRTRAEQFTARIQEPEAETNGLIDMNKL